MDHRCAADDRGGAGHYESLDIGTGEWQLPTTPGRDLRTSRFLSGARFAGRLDLGRRLWRRTRDRTCGRDGDDHRDSERDRTGSEGPDQEAAAADFLLGQMCCSQLAHADVRFALPPAMPNEASTPVPGRAFDHAWIYRPGRFTPRPREPGHAQQGRDSETLQGAELAPSSHFGRPIAARGIPVVGNWDGVGGDTIGVYRPGDRSWHLRNYNSAGAVSIAVFGYGGTGDRGVVGNWDGVGGGHHRRVPRWLVPGFRSSTRRSVVGG